MRTLNTSADNPYVIVYLYRRVIDGIDERTLHRILNPLLILAVAALIAAIIVIGFMAVLSLSN